MFFSTFKLGKRLNNKIGYLITVTFIFLYYFLFLANQLSTVSINMVVSAQEPGTMLVYSPDKDDKYNSEVVTPLKLNVEPTNYEFQVPIFSRRLKFRIDPDLKPNVIRISHLTISGWGQDTYYGASQILDEVSHSHGVEFIVEPESLIIRIQEDGSRLFFSSKPFKQSSAHLIVLPIIVLFLLVFVITRIFSRKWISLEGLNTLAAFGLLVIFIIRGLYPQHSILDALLIEALASIVIVCTLALLKHRWVPNVRFGFFPSVVLATFFLALISIPFFLSITPESLVKMKQEVRSVLRDKPDESLDVKLKLARDAIESSFLKHFSFRKDLLNLNAESKILVMGFSPTDKAIVGQDNWFFEGYGGRRVEKELVRPFDNLTDYMGQNPFTNEELEAWRVTLEERYYWLKERGSRYIFALAPTKALVYPEKLPKRILTAKAQASRPQRYDQLVDFLKNNSVVPVVDLREALLKGKALDPELFLYYRTDFHWNYYGSLLAYKAIITGLNDAYPDLELIPGRLDDFSVKKKTDWVHANFMTMVGLDPNRHRNETYYTFMPKNDSTYFNILDFGKQGISDYSMPSIQTRRFGTEKFHVREISNPNGKLPLMFVIGDSFIEKTLGYFSGHAQRLLNFRVVTQFPTEPYEAMGMRPDVVVQEILNMYLLQPPPKNPARVQAARERALAFSRVNGMNLRLDKCLGAPIIYRWVVLHHKTE